MLNDYQINSVWENLLAAETRALYFGELTTRYTRRKQIITGLTFFLSSGAAATIIAKAPAWVPTIQAVTVALVSAYAMAVGLDGRIATLAKLQSAWSEIATAYERLWNHAWDDDAEDELTRIIDRETEPSSLAATSAPHDPRLIERWQTRVFAMHGVDTPAA